MDFNLYPLLDHPRPDKATIIRRQLIYKPGYVSHREGLLVLTVDDDKVYWIGNHRSSTVDVRRMPKHWRSAFAHILEVPVKNVEAAWKEWKAASADRMRQDTIDNIKHLAHAARLDVTIRKKPL